MRLLLLRHGETAWNREGRCQGSTDVPLSETGRDQARALGARLARLVGDGGPPLAGAWTSPLGRARETATLALGSLGVEAVPDDRLRELGLGEWEGLETRIAAERFPDAWRLWKEDPERFQAPGGEPLVSARSRMASFVDERHAEHPHGTVLCFGHGYAGLAYLCHALGLPLSSFRRLWLSHASLTCLDLSGPHPVLRTLNDTSHLPER